MQPEWWNDGGPEQIAAYAAGIIALLVILWAALGAPLP